MHKAFSLIILAFATLCAQAGIKADIDSLKLHSYIVTSPEQDSRALLTHGVNNMSQHTDWPKGHANQAMLMVNWKGIPIEDVNDVRVTTDQGDPIEVRQMSSGHLQTWIFVPSNTKSVTLSHPRYGSDRIYLKSMKNKDIWSVPVILDKLVNIQINPGVDYGKSVRVTLTYPESGEEETKWTPASFSNIVPDTYEVRFVIDGRNRSETIKVTPTKTVFGQEDIDFRHFKSVTVEATGNSKLFIDDKPVGNSNTVTVSLPYGSHTFKAVISDNCKDEKTIDINENSESTIYLSPIESRTFEVKGMYKGELVETTISVPGLSPDRYKPGYSKSHSFTLPETTGKPYTYYLTYHGETAKKTIRVTPGMATSYEVNFKTTRRVVWPWQREYYPATSGWEFSWVSKQYATSAHLIEDSDIKTTIKENGIWDNGYDHWLHGVRMGYHAQPSLKIGLGLYTGIFLEAYFSKTDEAHAIDEIFDKYFELDLSFPLHVLYQIPLAKKFSIGFHTGPTLNWAMHGSYYDIALPNQQDTENFPDYTDFWKEPWAPKRVNITWDFGLFIRLRGIMFSGTLSQGITDNKIYADWGRDARTVMNKRMVGISFAF